MSVEAVHASRADTLIVPLTTRLSPQRFGDYILIDWEAAKLPKPSMAKAVIETVERSTFERTLGRLGNADMTAIDTCLREILGV